MLPRGGGPAGAAVVAGAAYLSVPLFAAGLARLVAAGWLRVVLVLATEAVDSLYVERLNAATVPAGRTLSRTRVSDHAMRPTSYTGPSVVRPGPAHNSVRSYSQLEL